MPPPGYALTAMANPQQRAIRWVIAGFLLIVVWYLLIVWLFSGLS